MPAAAKSPQEYRVAAVHDLTDGEMKTVTAGDTEVLLSRVDGQFHACGAHCTHYGAPLADGVLSGTTVICPWHHACFDVTSGALEEPPALDRLPRYAVRVDGDDVLVTVPADAENTPEGAAYRESAGEPPAMAERDFGDHPETAVILGAGAAGEAAAEALREFGFEGRVVMVTQEDVAPYDRTKLSKGYLAGKADDDGLPLRDEAFYQCHGIEVRTGQRVTGLDVEGRTLRFADAEPLRYSRLLIATGGTPRTLDVPGADRDGVLTLRSWRDAREITERAEEAERVVVIGSSFIGMETAASLRGRGKEVTVVSTDEEPFENVLGAEVGRVFRQLHEEKGVAFLLGSGVARIEGAGDGGLAVVTEAGERAEGDLVLVGIGVTPATGFAEGAEEIERGDDGGIVVDEHLRAADGVWVAGDVARFPERVSGERVRIEHWRLAQQHGRAAARNMGGEEQPFGGVPFFWSGQFGTSLRYVGHAEGWEEVVIDGSLDHRAFVAYYVQGDRVLAAAAVGRDRDAAAFHALMLDGRPPSAAEVRDGVDPQAQLRELNGAG